MPHTLREEIDIRAPVERVWEVVHQDIEHIPRWSQSLESAEVVGGGPVRRGSKLVYVAKVAGGFRQELHLKVTVYEEHVRCAGTLTSPAMDGKWSWRYDVEDGTTHVHYETQVQVKGMLRLGSRVLEDQIRKDVRRNLEALKRLVERGSRRR